MSADGIAERIGDKLKSMFSFGKERHWEKKGKAQKLGTTEVPASARQVSKPAGVLIPDPHVPTPHLAVSPRLQPKVSQSARLAAHEPSLDKAFLVSTPTGREASLIKELVPPVPAQESSNDKLVQIDSISTPTAAERKLTSFSRARQEDDYHLQQSLTLIVSQTDSMPTLETISRILTNVLEKPSEPKYRQIRLTNPKIQKDLVDTVGGVEFLEACGFQMEFEDAANNGTTVEGYLVLDNAADLGFIAHALHMLNVHLRNIKELLPAPLATDSSVSSAIASSPSGTSQSGALAEAPPASIPPAPLAVAKKSEQQNNAESRLPVERDTQVIFPVTPDTQVPDWFFAKTGADAKVEYHNIVKRREASELLTTRAYKERLAASNTVHHDHATIRVRFPEGICLQGTFGAAEPVTALFDWVTDSLQAPDTEYELIGPDRKPLRTDKTLKTAGLLGFTLLNFRMLRASASGTPPLSLLSDELLKKTRFNDVSQD